MKISLAIQITLLRIVLAPIIVGCIIFQQWSWSAILFTLAVLTDFLDGFVARRYHQESRLGQLLDPIADKTLIVSLMYVIFLAKSPVSGGGIGISVFGWFFIAKEVILLSAAAALYLRYDLFFKPTFFSRFVSVSEMFIIFEILTWRAFFGINSQELLPDSGNIEWVIGVICGLHLFLTMFLSLVLLIQYAVSVVLFLRKK